MADRPTTPGPRKRPAHLEVSINGVPLGETTLPDDPADARGVLSLHLERQWEYASYGFLTTLEADGAAAQRMLRAAQDGTLVVRFEVPRTSRSSGLNLYGARMGAYPVPPTLFLDTD